MTATTTARVEVLTAEVRVLMVGSRQVTLSVYAQLDSAERVEHIEPFGRVAPRDAESGWVYVVGASQRDADRGTLIRARCHDAAWLRREAARHRRLAETATERDSANDEHRRLADEHNRQAERGGNVWLRARELQNQFYLAKQELDRAGYGHWSADELTGQARTEEAAAEIAAQWEALPLIVLAGLR